MRRPDIFLIGLGAQKSATGWLAQYLRHHPQVFMSPIKEMHFWSTKYYKGKEGPFDRRFARRLEMRLASGGAGQRKTGKGGASAADLAERVGIGTDEAAYMEFFGKRAGGEKVWAEITPSYSLVDRDGFAAMEKVSPETRFVFLMRNPVDRYWSQLRFSKHARPDLDIFAVFDQYMRRPKFRLRTDYRRTLTEFLAAVPREKLFVEFYERLFTDAAVQRFCDFLSVSNVAADFTPRGETAVKASMTAEMRERGFRQFAHVYHYVDEFFEGDIPQSWRDDMVRYG